MVARGGSTSESGSTVPALSSQRDYGQSRETPRLVKTRSQPNIQLKHGSQQLIRETTSKRTSHPLLEPTPDLPTLATIPIVEPDGQCATACTTCLTTCHVDQRLGLPAWHLAVTSGLDLRKHPDQGRRCGQPQLREAISTQQGWHQVWLSLVAAISAAVIATAAA